MAVTTEITTKIAEAHAHLLVARSLMGDAQDLTRAESGRTRDWRWLGDITRLFNAIGEPAGIAAELLMLLADADEPAPEV
jgi:hypothetical protein